MKSHPEAKAHYINLIVQTDATLAMLREFWIGASNDNERSKMMERIDKALDERARLMKLRDA